VGETERRERGTDSAARTRTQPPSSLQAALKTPPSSAPAAPPNSTAARHRGRTEEPSRQTPCTRHPARHGNRQQHLVPQSHCHTPHATPCHTCYTTRTGRTHLCSRRGAAHTRTSQHTPRCLRSPQRWMTNPTPHPTHVPSSENESPHPESRLRTVSDDARTLVGRPWVQAALDARAS
jgi:hypothetical protein